MQACLHRPHDGGPGGASRVTADDPGGRKKPTAPEEHNICQTHPRKTPLRTSSLSAPGSEESSMGEDLVFTLSLPL
ncbi:hypothetical protein QQF64_031275 [Cirrhinus molitorella]|uniref:Uncharacterized protein n=1 Tax=Cirrhinus molitorella TaxID=172907 RepID=A0ABR3MWK9_9TELE